MAQTSRSIDWDERYIDPDGRIQYPRPKKKINDIINILGNKYAFEWKQRPNQALGLMYKF